MRRDDGKFDDLLVRVGGWRDVSANHFLVASQVWIDGVLHKRRPAADAKRRHFLPDIEMQEEIGFGRRWDMPRADMIPR